MLDSDLKILDTLTLRQALTAEKAKEIENEITAKGVNLENFLLENKIVNEEQITEARAQIAGMPYFNLLEKEVPEAILNFLPEEIAQTYKIICFAKEGREIKIGMVEPNLKAMEAVNFLAAEGKFKVEYYIVSVSSFKKTFKQYQKIEEEISSALQVKAEEDGDELIEVDSSIDNISSDEINSAPVSRIVAVIIRHAVEARASDIHIEPYAKESRVRYRIDGILHTSLVLPKSIHNAVIARIKVLAKLKLDETRVPQDGRIRLVVSNREIDFRVSTLPLASQEKVVMRILDTVAGVQTLENLGFNKLALTRIREGIKKTSGMVLVTGPTGSGKTTTLYSTLDILNKEGVNISTLEDPIEYEIKGINQSQVKPRIGFSFANGLRSLLRQDPDIIMVGEIRDEETAELSIHASLTGHLVLSTLHTNDAIGAVLRLLDMKVERFLLASTLKVIVAQRLARRLCTHCKQEVQLSEEAKEEIRAELVTLPENIIKSELPDFSPTDIFERYKIYQPVGCPRCENTGYSGRVSIAEVVEINDELKEIINAGEENLNEAVVRKTEDFISIKQDGMIKVLQGVTNLEEILRVIES
ncbi:MAG: ATPase, T2SS/T4P/T4SS family [Patescibacteria group bacterium]|nr:ATPase, T2SS/T4P/T4SS family [Patescibacteria group bacterium]